MAWISAVPPTNGTPRQHQPEADLRAEPRFFEGGNAERSLNVLTAN
jgi:hypothetical protein